MKHLIFFFKNSKTVLILKGQLWQTSNKYLPKSQVRHLEILLENLGFWRF